MGCCRKKENHAKEENFQNFEENKKTALVLFMRNFFTGYDGCTVAGC